MDDQWVPADERFRHLEPPPGVRAWRASAWCGYDGHPRVVLVAPGRHQLEREEYAWRCPVCGEPDRWRPARLPPRWRPGRREREEMRQEAGR